MRRFGARAGANMCIFATARIWYRENMDIGENAVIGPGAICYFMAPITLGAYAIISQRAYLCAAPTTWKTPISILSRARS